MTHSLTLNAAWFVILAFFLPLNSIAGESEKPLVVCIASYQNVHKDRYKRNLDSVFRQRYNHYRVIYIDDHSPDGTGRLVREYVESLGQNGRFTLIQNDVQMGCMANKYKMYTMCDPSEIILELDGDDAFFHDDVMNCINRAYSDSNTWMTYGNFVIFPHMLTWEVSGIPDEIIRKNSFREEMFGTGTIHLRTFYSSLFQKIDIGDLMHEGKFVDIASDMAYMIPMLEMAGNHSRFIPDVLYLYDGETSMNDYARSGSRQQYMDFQVIRKWPKYLPLKDLNSPPEKESQIQQNPRDVRDFR